MKERAVSLLKGVAEFRLPLQDEILEVGEAAPGSTRCGGRLYRGERADGAAGALGPRAVRSPAWMCV